MIQLARRSLKPRAYNARINGSHAATAIKFKLPICVISTSLNMNAIAPSNAGTLRSHPPCNTGGIEGGHGHIRNPTYIAAPASQM